MVERTGWLVIGFVCWTFLASATGPAVAQRPDWENHLNWCLVDTATGAGTNCQDQYIQADQAECVKNGKCQKVAGCVVSGGRSCLMKVATQAARDKQCEHAFRLALVCQCQNPNAQQSLKDAGAALVCGFLK